MRFFFLHFVRYNRSWFGAPLIPCSVGDRGLGGRGRGRCRRRRGRAGGIVVDGVVVGRPPARCAAAAALVVGHLVVVLRVRAEYPAAAAVYKMTLITITLSLAQDHPKRALWVSE